MDCRVLARVGSTAQVGLSADGAHLHGRQGRGCAVSPMETAQREMAHMAARINQIIVALGSSAPQELKAAAVALAKADLALCDAAFDASARQP